MRARENPFRAECIESLRYRFDAGTLDTLLERLAAAGYRGAIVGPHGAGKTTLVEELFRELNSRGLLTSRIRLTDSRAANLPRIKEWLIETPESAILILDSAGQLNWWDWKRFERRAAAYRGLIITVHSPGRLPTLIHCESRFDRFCELVGELDPELTLARSELATIYHAQRGNVRDCFRQLYDRWGDKERGDECTKR